MQLPALPVRYSLYPLPSKQRVSQKFGGRQGGRVTLSDSGRAALFKKVPLPVWDGQGSGNGSLMELGPQSLAVLGRILHTLPQDPSGAPSANQVPGKLLRWRDQHLPASSWPSSLTPRVTGPSWYLVLLLTRCLCQECLPCSASHNPHPRAAGSQLKCAITLIRAN